MNKQKELSKKVETAIFNKHFEEDEVFNFYLSEKSGDLELSSFKFSIEFKEDSKEEFKVTKLGMESLNKD